MVAQLFVPGECNRYALNLFPISRVISIMWGQLKHILRREVITESPRAIDSELVELNGFGPDWRIHRYDGWTLTLVAGRLLTYYHALELDFVGVSYVELPTEFSWPLFRTGTTAELARLRSFLDLCDQQCYIIEAEGSNSRSAQEFVVCAESFTIRRETVTYHEAA